MTKRRLYDRHEISMPVVIECGSVEANGLTRNIGLGGMFIFTDLDASYGTPVIVRLRLPSFAEESLFEAVVRWNEEDGLGVQFGSLRALEVWGLNQLFRVPAGAG
jgi:hypothetical protein